MGSKLAKIFWCHLPCPHFRSPLVFLLHYSTICDVQFHLPKLPRLCKNSLKRCETVDQGQATYGPPAILVRPARLVEGKIIWMNIMCTFRIRPPIKIPSFSAHGGKKIAHYSCRLSKESKPCYSFLLVTILSCIKCVTFMCASMCRASDNFFKGQFI